MISPAGCGAGNAQRRDYVNQPHCFSLAGSRAKPKRGSSLGCGYGRNHRPSTLPTMDGHQGADATTYLETLNPEQRRAVEDGASGGLATSPLLVIAGAGSGKTNSRFHARPAGRVRAADRHRGVGLHPQAFVDHRGMPGGASPAGPVVGTSSTGTRLCSSRRGRPIGDSGGRLYSSVFGKTEHHGSRHK
jgi:hypothetical protein